MNNTTSNSNLDNTNANTEVSKSDAQPKEDPPNTSIKFYALLNEVYTPDYTTGTKYEDRVCTVK